MTSPFVSVAPGSLAGGLIIACVSALNRGFTAGFETIQVHALVAPFIVGAASAGAIGYFFIRYRSTLQEQLAAQVLAGETLAASERQFRNLFEGAEISIWNEDLSAVCTELKALRAGGVSDLRQYLTEHEEKTVELLALVRVIQVNEATLTLFGAEAQDEFISSIDRTFGPDAVAVFVDGLCAIWEKRNVFRSEATLQTLHGDRIDAIVSFRVPETEDGFRSVPVSIIDITKRKAVERQLAHAQRMDAVGQLTGGVAHDFNNLMAVVIGNAELLEDGVEGGTRARRHIDAIKIAIDRGTSLTRRLLAFSRQTNLVPAAVDVADLIDGLEDLLRRTLGETIELNVEHAPDIWPAMVDRHQFENALINLALNARDAMPDGGSLAMRAANVTLDQAYSDRHDDVGIGNFIQVSVSDTGTGMVPDVQAKAFEPFFTTKGPGKGSGLGLSMVYGFVKQSKGHITLHCEADRGTTIDIYLPQALDALEISEAAPEPTAGYRGLERVLVVEDNEGVREVPVAILREQGYHVVEVANGLEAIQQLQRGQPFGLLFTDVVLPGGIGGVEIAEEAKRRTPDIKVLFTTGYADNAAEQSGVMRRGENLVLKPYRRVELLKKVRTLLDG